MRIFYAADTSPNPEFESNLWRNNLYRPLVDLKHEVVEFQYDMRKTFKNLDMENPGQRAFIEKNRPRITEELLRQVKAVHSQEPVDLFFSYFYDACVLPEAIDEIRSMGIKTVNWYCNGSYQLHLVSEISPHYDWCLVPEKFRLEDYKAMGAHPVYCQEAANPGIYRPYDLPVEFDVTFVGQAYGDRMEYIKYLYDNGIKVKVWGSGWSSGSKSPVQRVARICKGILSRECWKKARVSHKDHASSPLSVVPASISGGVLSDEGMIKMYSRSRINLGFSTCGNTHESEERIVQVRLRDFEVPMSGGFYMVEYMEELEEFFDIGNEIVCYTDKEDMLEKIRYYLEHDDERERIRLAGYERCRRDHSWHKRFMTVFNEMGLE